VPEQPRQASSAAADDDESDADAERNGWFDDFYDDDDEAAKVAESDARDVYDTTMDASLKATSTFADLARTDALRNDVEELECHLSQSSEANHPDVTALPAFVCPELGNLLNPSNVAVPGRPSDHIRIVPLTTLSGRLDLDAIMSTARSQAFQSNVITERAFVLRSEELKEKLRPSRAAKVVERLCGGADTSIEGKPSLESDPMSTPLTLSNLTHSPCICKGANSTGDCTQAPPCRRDQRVPSCRHAEEEGWLYAR
jgi:hypothetical protein